MMSILEKVNGLRVSLDVLEFTSLRLDGFRWVLVVKHPSLSVLIATTRCHYIQLWRGCTPSALMKR